MTANELADYITVNEIRTVTIDMVANMLRQQQAKIEALKEFAIWMTGCGYDFRQHIYFNEFYDEFLMKEKEHE